MDVEYLCVAVGKMKENKHLSHVLIMRAHFSPPQRLFAQGFITLRRAKAQSTVHT